LDAYPKGPDRRVTSNVLLSIITVVLVGALLRYASSVIIPLLVAGFLAYLMDPLVSFLRRLKVPVIAGVLLAALLFLVGFLVFGWILYHSALEFAKAFPKYQHGFVELMRGLIQRIQRVANTLIGLDHPLEQLQQVPLGSILLSTLRSLANILREFLVVYVFSLLFLVGKYGLVRKLLRSFPRKEAKKIAVVLMHIDADLRKYIGVKSLASLLVGIAAGLALSLFRVEFAVVIGFLTFVLNFVPIIGSIIAVIIPVLLAAVQFSSWVMALWVLLTLLVLHNLVAQLFEPKVLGMRLNLSVPIIFLSLLFWGWLWGAAGVLLAVPMTTSVKIIIEDIPGLRHFALLLEKAPRKKRLGG
jgi:predicted PurR-regulated permease PerM